jgi:hypothetical protein
VALVASASLGCRAAPPAAPGDARGDGPASDPRAGAPSEVVWAYDVHAGARPALALALTLRVDATFAPKSCAGEVTVVDVDDAARPFVHDVECETAGGWRPAPPNPGGGWRVLRRAEPSGCHVRYTLALAEAAARIDDVETAWTGGGIVVAPPSTWLLRPSGTDRTATGATGTAGTTGATGERFRFRVTTEPGLRFATGLHPAPSGAADTFEAPVAVIDDATSAVFGPFADDTVDLGTSHIEVATAPRGLPIDEATSVDWVKTAAGGLARYYGTFPAARSLVIVAPGSAPVTRGETFGEGGPAIVLRVGDKFTRASIADDWVLTHELVHVTMPSLGRPHAWLEEGLATYVEPIARARAGLVQTERFWRDLVEGIPQGLPEAGDQGLERTHTWGRTYWGGALFCLVADVRIRERTKGARSFDDALRGIVAAGADVESHWTVDRFVEVGDRATGTTVLAELYRSLALAPGTIDLPSLWARLGVRPGRAEGAVVTFDDAAPLAAVRRAITRGAD